MRLIGVGIGPGHPELLTPKVLRALRAAVQTVVALRALRETGRVVRAVVASCA